MSSKSNVSANAKGSATTPKTFVPPLSSVTSPGVAAVAKGASTLNSPPPGWTATQDAFIKAAAARGEDKASTRILLETEYPNLSPVSEAFIQSRLDAKV